MPLSPVSPGTAEEWMAMAIAQARLALDSGDVPVGAVLVDREGRPLAVGRNERELTGDPTAHAEVVAIRAAARRLGTWNLAETTLIVTLEPCTMCAGAVMQARIPRLIFGAWDAKAGAVGSIHDVLRDRRTPHPVEVLAGIGERECSTLLSQFFQDRR